MPYTDPARAKARHDRYYAENRRACIDRSMRYKKAHPRKENAVTVRKRGRKHDSAVREFMKRIKESSPCMDCGVFYPGEVMDYDHVRGVKSFAVSALNKCSLARVCEEIEKCDLVCSNCHRIRHINRRKTI